VADSRHELGRRAEQHVADWFTALGWTILAHRWRCRAGEIDLVCRDPAGRLVGVEVRARRSGRAGFPLDSLTPRHRARLRAALVEYAIVHREANTGLRVDLVTAEPVRGRRDLAWRLVRHPNIDAW
jgi:putative endonuclease